MKRVADHGRDGLRNLLRRRSHVAGLALVMLSVLGCEALLFRNIWRGYQPWFDTIPLLVESTPLGGRVEWTKWFTEGWSKYFVAWPGWPSPQSLFLRPVVNAWFLLEYEVFGRAWSGYLLANYLVNGVVSGAVWWIARRRLRLARVDSALASMLFCASSPAWMTWLHPSYITDALAGASVAGAFVALGSGRRKLCASLLLLGLFAKETVLAGAIAAPLEAALLPCTSCPKWRKLKHGVVVHDIAARSIGAGLLAVPLAVWLTVRTSLFGAPAFDRTYAYDYLVTQWSVTRLLAYWPAPVVQHESYLETFRSARLLVSAVNAGLLILILAVLLFRPGIGTHREESSSRLSPISEARRIALWAGCGVLMLMFRVFSAAMRAGCGRGLTGSSAVGVAG